MLHVLLPNAVQALHLTGLMREGGRGGGWRGEEGGREGGGGGGGEEGRTVREEEGKKERRGEGRMEGYVCKKTNDNLLVNTLPLLPQCL